MITNTVVVMFDCPIHGLEYQVFCFRAYDDTLSNRWKKIMFVEMSITEEEQKQIVKNIVEADTHV